MSDPRGQLVGTLSRGPRRWTPWSLVAVMTLLAAGSLVASLHTAPRYSYFASPPSGDPRVVSTFHTVVRRTLAEPSFRFDNAIEYRSPDLFLVQYAAPTPSSLIEVGHELYFPLRTTTPEPRWGRVLLTSNVARNIRIDAPKVLLNSLLHADDVARDGDSNFTVTTVGSASSFDPNDAGQVEATMTVYVNDDLISSVVTTLRGWMTVNDPLGAPRPTGLTRVSSIHPFAITYGDFGHVARFGAPPLSETTPLIICDNGAGYEAPSRGTCVDF